MYTLFLVICVAFVILSPLVLDLWLTIYEKREERRRSLRLRQAKGPSIAWASVRLPDWL